MNPAAYNNLQPELFAFVPRIKPYRIIPSEEDPKELLLILEENGAALGISYTERLLIERLDGRHAVGDIVLQTANDSQVKLAGIRKLLWDLDRFGFLEESPWGQTGYPEAWGYWGTRSKPLATFYYSWTLPWIEHRALQIGMLIAALTALIYGWGAWEGVRVGIVNASVTQGLFAMVCGAVIAMMLSSWDAARALSALHESPAGFALFWNSPFLSLKADGRRLRALSFRNALYVLLRPVLMILLVACFCLWLAKNSADLRTEWLVHLSLGMLLVAGWQLLPWTSTLLSRDVALRLRGDSGFWIAWRAMQKALQSLWSAQTETEQHHRLFFVWGVWTIFSTAIVLRIAALGFRMDFPVLYTHFLQEHNAFLLWFFITLNAVVLIGVAALLALLSKRLIRECFFEIYAKAFPQYDHWIALSILSAVLLVALLCIFSGYHRSAFFLNSLTWIIGGAFIAVGVKRLSVESKGYPAVLYFLTAYVGILLLLLGVLRYLGASPPLQSSVQWLWLGGFIPVFLAEYHLSWIAPSQDTRPKPSFLWIFFWIALVLFHLGLKKQDMNLGVSNSDLRAFLLVLETGWLCCMTYPLRFTQLAGLPVVAFFPFWMEGVGEAPLGELYLFSLCFMAAGMLSGYVLYRGGLARAFNASSGQPLLFVEGDIHKTVHTAIVRGLENLLQSPVHPSLRQSCSRDHLREMLQSLNRRLGTVLMQAVFRCAIKQTDWQAAQTLASIMPPQVQLPKLSHWDQQKVISYLRNVPTFMQVGGEIEQIAAITRFQLFQPQERLITQGKAEEELYIIVQGKASIVTEHAFGQTRLAVMSAGDFVGEIGFLSGSARTASVWALEPMMVLAVHRRDISASMPETQKRIREAEAGRSWLQRLYGFAVFREFPPGLLTRVSLESQHVHLEAGKTVVMHHDLFLNSIAVILSGEVILQQEEQNIRLKPGQIGGLTECILRQPVHGVIRAESLTHLLMVNRQLLYDALMELIVPKQMLYPTDPSHG